MPNYDVRYLDHHGVLTHAFRATCDDETRATALRANRVASDHFSHSFHKYSSLSSVGQTSAGVAIFEEPLACARGSEWRL